MKSSLKKKTLVIVLVVGVVAVAGASVVRYRFLHSSGYRLTQALQNPKFKQLDAEAAKLEAAVAASPNDVKARRELCEMYKKVGLLDKAVEQLDAINKLNPGDKKDIGELADLSLVIGNSRKAEKHYREMTQKWPGEAAAWAQLATCLYQQRKATEAIASIRMAVQLEPKNDNHHYVLATCLLQYAYQFPGSPGMQNLFADAKKELEDLLPKWPIPGEIHFQLARALDGLKDRKGAMKHYEEAVKLMPTRVEIPIMLANLYIDAADRTAARKLVESSLKRFPNVAALHDLNGQLIQTSSAPDAQQKAYEAYKRAVQLEGDNFWYLDHLGSSALRLNKLGEAAEALMHSVKINENRSFPYQQLAAVFARMGDRNHSNAAADMAAKMVHNEQTLRQLIELAQVYPDDMRTHVAIADRWRQLGMVSAARDKYLQILQFAPGDKHCTEAIAAIDRERDQREEKQQQASAKP